ncbi:Cell death abnormality protein 1 [Diplonema papillatum]|nr:Cell death abnormality protein 1 [Diplonema papillatum]
MPLPVVLALALAVLASETLEGLKLAHEYAFDEPAAAARTLPDSAGGSLSSFAAADLNFTNRAFYTAQTYAPAHPKAWPGTSIVWNTTQTGLMAFASWEADGDQTTSEGYSFEGWIFIAEQTAGEEVVLLQSNASAAEHGCELLVADRQLSFRHFGIANYTVRNPFLTKYPTPTATLTLQPFNATETRPSYTATLGQETFNTSTSTGTVSKTAVDEPSATRTATHSLSTTGTLHSNDTSSPPYFAGIRQFSMVPLDTGRWVHVTFVYSSPDNAVRFYADGVYLGEQELYPHMPRCEFSGGDVGVLSWEPGAVAAAPLMWRFDNFRFYYAPLTGGNVTGLFEGYQPHRAAVEGTRRVGDALRVEFEGIKSFADERVVAKLAARPCTWLSSSNSSHDLSPPVPWVANSTGVSLVAARASDVGFVCFSYDGGGSWVNVSDLLVFFDEAQATSYKANATGTWLVGSPLRTTIEGTGLDTRSGWDAAMIVSIPARLLYASLSSEVQRQVLVSLCASPGADLMFLQSDLLPTDAQAQVTAHFSFTPSQAGDFVLCYRATGAVVQPSLSPYLPIFPIIHAVSGSGASPWLTVIGAPASFFTSTSSSFPAHLVLFLDAVHLSYTSIAVQPAPKGWSSDLISLQFAPVSPSSSAELSGLFTRKLSEASRTELGHAFNYTCEWCASCSVPGDACDLTVDWYEGLPTDFGYYLDERVWEEERFTLLVLKPLGAGVVSENDHVRLEFVKDDADPGRSIPCQRSSSEANWLDVSPVSGSGNATHRYFQAVLPSNIGSSQATVCYQQPGDTVAYRAVSTILGFPLAVSFVSSYTIHPYPPFAAQPFALTISGYNIQPPPEINDTIAFSTTGSCAFPDIFPVSPSPEPVLNIYLQPVGRAAEFIVDQVFRTAGSLTVCYHAGPEYAFAGFREVPTRATPAVIVEKPSALAIFPTQNVVYMTGTGEVDPGLLFAVQLSSAATGAGVGNRGAVCRLSLVVESVWEPLPPSTVPILVGVTEVAVGEALDATCDFSGLFGAPEGLFGWGRIQVVVTLTDGTELKDHVSVFTNKPCDEAFDCSGHGQCNANGTCVCTQDVSQGFWDGADCSACSATYYGGSCRQYCDAAVSCSGHGSCSSFGKCMCDAYYRGDSCEQCKSGYALPSCSTCAPSYFGADCGLLCTPTATCHGRGTCTSFGDCACALPFIGPYCAECAPGYTGELCSQSAPVAEAPQCSSENKPAVLSAVLSGDWSLLTIALSVPPSGDAVANVRNCNYLFSSLAGECWFEGPRSVVLRNRAAKYRAGHTFSLRQGSFGALCSVDAAPVAVTAPAPLTPLQIGVSNSQSYASCESVHLRITGLTGEAPVQIEWTPVSGAGVLAPPRDLVLFLRSQAGNSAVELPGDVLPASGSYAVAAAVTDAAGAAAGATATFFRRSAGDDSAAGVFPSAFLDAAGDTRRETAQGVRLSVSLGFPGCLFSGSRSTDRVLSQAYSYTWVVVDALQRTVDLTPLAASTYRPMGTLLAPAGFFSPLFSPYRVTVVVASRLTARATETLARTVAVEPGRVALSVEGAGRQYTAGAGASGGSRLRASCVDGELAFSTASARVPASSVELLWGCSGPHGGAAAAPPVSPGARCAVFEETPLGLPDIPLALHTPGMYRVVVACRVTWVNDIVPFERTATRDFWIAVARGNTTEPSSAQAFLAVASPRNLPHPYPFHRRLPLGAALFFGEPANATGAPLVTLDGWSVLNGVEPESVDPGANGAPPSVVLSPGKRYLFALRVSARWVAMAPGDDRTTITSEQHLTVFVDASTSIVEPGSVEVEGGRETVECFEAVKVFASQWRGWFDGEPGSLEYNFDVSFEDPDDDGDGGSVFYAARPWQADSVAVVAIPWLPEETEVFIIVTARDAFGALASANTSVTVAAQPSALNTSEIAYDLRERIVFDRRSHALSMAGVRDLVYVLSHVSKTDPAALPELARGLFPGVGAVALPGGTISSGLLDSLLTLFPFSGLDRTSAACADAAAAMAGILRLFGDPAESDAPVPAATLARVLDLSLQITSGTQDAGRQHSVSQALAVTQWVASSLVSLDSNASVADDPSGRGARPMDADVRETLTQIFLAHLPRVARLASVDGDFDTASSLDIPSRPGVYGSLCKCKRDLASVLLAGRTPGSQPDDLFDAVVHWNAPPVTASDDALILCVFQWPGSLFRQAADPALVDNARGVTVALQNASAEAAFELAALAANGAPLTVAVHMVLPAIALNSDGRVVDGVACAYFDPRSGGFSRTGCLLLMNSSIPGAGLCTCSSMSYFPVHFVLVDETLVTNAPPPVQATPPPVAAALDADDRSAAGIVGYLVFVLVCSALPAFHYANAAGRGADPPPEAAPGGSPAFAGPDAAALASEAVGQPRVVFEPGPLRYVRGARLVDACLWTQLLSERLRRAGPLVFPPSSLRRANAAFAERVFVAACCVNVVPCVCAVAARVGEPNAAVAAGSSLASTACVLAVGKGLVFLYARIPAGRGNPYTEVEMAEADAQDAAERSGGAGISLAVPVPGLNPASSPLAAGGDQARGVEAVARRGHAVSIVVDEGDPGDAPGDSAQQSPSGKAAGLHRGASLVVGNEPGDSAQQSPSGKAAGLHRGASLVVDNEPGDSAQQSPSGKAAGLHRGASLVVGNEPGDSAQQSPSGKAAGLHRGASLVVGNEPGEQRGMTARKESFSPFRIAPLAARNNWEAGGGGGALGGQLSPKRSILKQRPSEVGVKGGAARLSIRFDEPRRSSSVSAFLGEKDGFAQVRRRSFQRWERATSAQGGPHDADGVVLAQDELRHAAYHETRCGRLRCAAAVLASESLFARGFFGLRPPAGKPADAANGALPPVPPDFLATDLDSVRETVVDLFVACWNEQTPACRRLARAGCAGFAAFPDTVAPGDAGGHWDREMAGHPLWCAAEAACGFLRLRLGAALFALSLLSLNADLFPVLACRRVPASADELVSAILTAPCHVGVLFARDYCAAALALPPDTFAHAYKTSPNPSADEVLAICLLRSTTPRRSWPHNAATSSPQPYRFDAPEPQRAEFDRLVCDGEYLQASHVLCALLSTAGGGSSGGAGTWTPDAIADAAEPGGVLRRPFDLTGVLGRPGAASLPFARLCTLQALAPADRPAAASAMLAGEGPFHTGDGGGGGGGRSNEWLARFVGRRLPPQLPRPPPAGAVFAAPPAGGPAAFFALNQLSPLPSSWAGTGSEDNPFSSVAAALPHLRRRDVLVLHPGEYPPVTLCAVNAPVSPRDDLAPVLRIAAHPGASKPVVISGQGVGPAVTAAYSTRIECSGIQFADCSVAVDASLSTSVTLDDACRTPEQQPAVLHCARHTAAAPGAGFFALPAHARSLARAVTAATALVLIVATAVLSAAFSQERALQWGLLCLTCFVLDVAVLQPAGAFILSRFLPGALKPQTR